MGARLAEARELFRYKRDEGGFEGWIEQRLSVSRRTAYDVLAVYERFGGEKVCDALHTLPRRVLYALAAPSTPDAVVTEATERTTNGETVSLADVKAMKAEVLCIKLERQ